MTINQFIGKFSLFIGSVFVVTYCVYLLYSETIQVFLCTVIILLYYVVVCCYCCCYYSLTCNE